MNTISTQRLRELRAEALMEHSDNIAGWFWIAVENELDLAEATICSFPDVR
jgi:hypothetical protein